MKQYLLSRYQSDGGPPPPEFLEPRMRDLDVLVQDIKAAGGVGLQRRSARPEHGHRGAVAQ
jgi:hypothetical protein